MSVATLPHLLHRPCALQGHERRHLAGGFCWALPRRGGPSGAPQVQRRIHGHDRWVPVPSAVLAGHPGVGGAAGAAVHPVSAEGGGGAEQGSDEGVGATSSATRMTSGCTFSTHEVVVQCRQKVFTSKMGIKVFNQVSIYMP